MKLNMKKMLMAAAIFALPSFAQAQENPTADLSVDLVTKHLWRGQDYGGVSIQPHGRISYLGLFFDAFASKSFDKDDKERIDFYAGYKAPFGLNISVGSHWMSNADWMNRYFHFKKEETGHQFEANLGYECKWFDLQAYTILGGNDLKKDGKRAFSTIFLLTVPFRLAGLDWQGRVGFTPAESSSYETPVEGNIFYDSVTDYLYADGPAVVEAAIRATKDINAKGFHVPVYMEFNANPYTKRASIMAGVSIRPFQKK